MRNDCLEKKTALTILIVLVSKIGYTIRNWKYVKISMISSCTKTECTYNKLDEWVKWDKG